MRTPTSSSPENQLSITSSDSPSTHSTFVSASMSIPSNPGGSDAFLEHYRQEVSFTRDEQERLVTCHLATGEKWVRIKSIGVGGFGRVYLEECIEGSTKADPGSTVGDTRAVKTFSDDDPVEQPVEAAAERNPWSGPNDWATKAEPIEFPRHSIMNEVQVQLRASELSRDHFPQCKCWYEDRNGKISVVMEFFQGGCCSHFFSKRQAPKSESLNAPTKLDWRENHARQVMKQVLEALSLLHSQHITHRDVKPGNVLISSSPSDENIRVKLGDFGLAFQHTDPDAKADSKFLCRKGTPYFYAPEMFPDLPTECYEETLFRQEAKADIWAAGILAFALLTPKLGPFDISRDREKDPQDLRGYVKNKRFDAGFLRRQGASPAAIDFITFLLDIYPSRRPDAKQALGHPWIAGASRSRTHFSFRGEVTIPDTGMVPCPGVYPILRIAKVDAGLLVLRAIDLTLVDVSAEPSSPARIIATYPWDPKQTQVFTRFIFPHHCNNTHVVLTTQDDRLISLRIDTLQPVSHIDTNATIAGTLAPSPAALYQASEDDVDNPWEYLPTGHPRGLVSIWRYRPSTGHLTPFYPDGRALVLPTRTNDPVQAVAVQRDPRWCSPCVRLRVAQGGCIYPLNLIDGIQYGAGEEPRLMAPPQEDGSVLEPEVRYKPEYDHLDILQDDANNNTGSTCGWSGTPVVARRWNTAGGCSVAVSWGGLHYETMDELFDWVHLQRREVYVLGGEPMTEKAPLELHVNSTEPEFGVLLAAAEAETGRETMAAVWQHWPLSVGNLATVGRQGMSVMLWERERGEDWDEEMALAISGRERTQWLFP
ncbi:kinase-like domain-containing protein [Podospora conica]|nr:kinase-like domain-containing protein [Schizothecium conicum]